MSVRAYKIEKVSTEPSFNIWHDNAKIIDWLLMNCGLAPENPSFCIDEIDLPQMEKELEGMVDKEELDKFISRIRQDIGDKGSADYISY